MVAGAKFWWNTRDVLTPMVAKVFPQGRIPHTGRLQLHFGNCRVYFSKVTEQFITDNHLGSVPHPPYSPNLAPSNFWLFGHVKTSLVGHTFDDPEQRLVAISEFLNEMQPPKVVAVFSHWVERVRWVLQNNGDDYHEQIHLLGKHFLLRLPEPWHHYLLTALYYMNASIRSVRISSMLDVNRQFQRFGLEISQVRALLRPLLVLLLPARR
jgi:hypothetical protein